MKTSLAPIALFTFKRPAQTMRTLESLSRNTEFAASPLYVYCDNARTESEVDQVSAVRRLVHEWPHQRKTIIERAHNWGLANSVIAGVTELCERFGKVIAVEDDLVVSPVFLSYLNAALEFYAGNMAVMQISGHMFPVPLSSHYDAVILPFSSSWGWATWDRAWRLFDPSMSGLETLKANPALRRRFDLDGAYPYFRMLERQARGAIDSWAVRWYKSVFFNDGYVLYPRQSLVKNIGFGKDATHSTSGSRREVSEVCQVMLSKFPPVRVQREVMEEVCRFLRSETSVRRRLSRRLGTWGPGRWFRGP